MRLSSLKWLYFSLSFLHQNWSAQFLSPFCYLFLKLFAYFVENPVIILPWSPQRTMSRNLSSVCEILCLLIYILPLPSVCDPFFYGFALSLPRQSTNQKVSELGWRQAATCWIVREKSSKLQIQKGIPVFSPLLLTKSLYPGSTSYLTFQCDSLSLSTESLEKTSSCHSLCGDLVTTTIWPLSQPHFEQSPTFRILHIKVAHGHHGGQHKHTGWALSPGDSIPIDFDVNGVRRVV